ncbi:MAG: pyridoxine 5'-phosphate synthase [Myxococcota bacterium]
MKSIRLGVNVDHIATVREARGAPYPDPVVAATLAEMAGADQITIHLREDRRHIKDRDLRIMRDVIQTVLNLEMAATDEMIEIACAVKPDTATLVPEKREELTTEGGLNVFGNKNAIKNAVSRLKTAGIRVSLFIDPDEEQIVASKEIGAQIIEIHTGSYANAIGEGRDKELERIIRGARAAAKEGLIVAAGHGLHYHNIQPLVEIEEIEEFNIGHSIIARALFVGISQAVKEMKALLVK